LPTDWLALAGLGEACYERKRARLGNATENQYQQRQYGGGAPFRKGVGSIISYFLGFQLWLVDSVLVQHFVERRAMHAEFAIGHHAVKWTPSIGPPAENA